jgi:hypothetical protein
VAKEVHVAVRGGVAGEDDGSWSGELTEEGR